MSQYVSHYYTIDIHIKMPVQTRSMTKSCSEKKINVQSKPPTSKVRILTIVNPKTTSKINTEVIKKNVSSVVINPNKPPVDILTTSQANALGLIPDYPLDNRRKVIPAAKLEWLISASNNFRGKWAVAPDGWYWKACSEKGYFWFDWFELRKM